MPERATFQSELPAPSAELVLLRTGTQALIRTLGRRKGERLLREWATLVATEEAVRHLFPPRGLGERANVLKARREAVAWLEAIMPALVATLPDE